MSKNYIKQSFESFNYFMPIFAVYIQLFDEKWHIYVEILDFFIPFKLKMWEFFFVQMFYVNHFQWPILMPFAA